MINNVKKETLIFFHESLSYDYGNSDGFAVFKIWIIMCAAIKVEPIQVLKFPCGTQFRIHNSI